MAAGTDPFNPGTSAQSSSLCCVRASFIVGSSLGRIYQLDGQGCWDALGSWGYRRAQAGFPGEDCASTRSFEAGLTISHGLAAVMHHPRPPFTLPGRKAGWSCCPHRETFSSSADNRMWGSSKTNKQTLLRLMCVFSGLC